MEIARHRAGIGIDDLHSALADIVSRRTLQRRLGELAEQKHISAMGQGKARMYRALGTVDIYATHAETGEPGEETRFEIYVPISSDGREILDYLRQPIQLRNS